MLHDLPLITSNAVTLVFSGTILGLKLETVPAPLSPYAGKYAGYAIERGKLSIVGTYDDTRQNHPLNGTATVEEAGLVWVGGRGMSVERPARRDRTKRG